MKMTTLCTLKPDEIFSLIKYIEKFAKDDEDKRNFALSHIKNFFTDMTLEQEIEFFSIVERENYLDMRDFINANPHIKVNLDGDSKIEDPNGWETKAKALDASYELASKSKETKLSRQIINARELNCLRHVKDYSYTFEKLKITKEFRLPKSVVSLEKYEALGSTVKRLLARVFEYMRKHSYDSTFFEYVFYYLDVVAEDVDHTTKACNEFIANMNKLLNVDITK